MIIKKFEEATKVCNFVADDSISKTFEKPSKLAGFFFQLKAVVH